MMRCDGRAFFTRRAEGERIGSRGYRVPAELPQIEALELTFGPDFEVMLDGEWHRVERGTFLSRCLRTWSTGSGRVAVRVVCILNFHTPNAGFLAQLRQG